MSETGPDSAAQPAVSTQTSPESAPATSYDLASQFLVNFDSKDPRALHALIVQLVQAYGVDAVYRAAQNLAVIADGLRWQAYGTMAALHRQPIPPHPYPQPNPHPSPNFAAAVKTIADFEQAQAT